MKKVINKKGTTDLGEFRLVCDDAVVGKYPDYSGAEHGAKMYCKAHPNKHVYICQISGILFGAVEVVQIEES